MELRKQDIFDLMVGMITEGIPEAEFLRFHKKWYVFKISLNKGLPYQQLHLRMHKTQGYFYAVMRSVYDRALIRPRSTFHSDGIFNKSYWVFNRVSQPRYFPRSIQFDFDHTRASFISAIEQFLTDFDEQKTFYASSDKCDMIITEGLDYLNRITTPPIELLKALDNNSRNGHFFRRITLPEYKALIAFIEPLWNFEGRDLQGFGGNDEDKKYYFTFHLLYFYINHYLPKPRQNRIYKRRPI